MRSLSIFIKINQIKQIFISYSKIFVDLIEEMSYDNNRILIKSMRCLVWLTVTSSGK